MATTAWIGKCSGEARTCILSCCNEIVAPVIVSHCLKGVHEKLRRKECYAGNPTVLPGIR